MMNRRQYDREKHSQVKKHVMTYIPVHKKERVDLAVDIVDISPGGVGISADSELEEGFVELRDFMGEDKKGVIAWSRDGGDASFRAGIQFVPVHEGVWSHVTKAEFSLPEFENPGLVTSMLVDEFVHFQEWERKDS